MNMLYYISLGVFGALLFDVAKYWGGRLKEWGKTKRQVIIHNCSQKAACRIIDDASKLNFGDLKEIADYFRVMHENAEAAASTNCRCIICLEGS